MTATYNNGDTAVVKSLIAGSGETAKYSYTAYVYDSSLTAWKAMDGNYSANNVYFENDITLAGDYTSVGNIKLSDKTLSATGKSVKTLMDNIFTKELNPTKSNPAISLTVSGANGEVGSSYNVPKATLRLTSVGSYTYGPSTGITVPVSSASVNCTTEGTSKSNESVIGLNGTLELPEGASKKYVDGNTTYSYSAEATHTAGAMPVTNLGNDYPSA